VTWHHIPEGHIPQQLMTFRETTGVYSVNQNEIYKHILWVK